MDTKQLKESNLDGLFKLIDEVRERGNLFMIKYDGERADDFITVLITFPVYENKEIIRYDGNDLVELIQKALMDFYETL